MMYKTTTKISEGISLELVLVDGWTNENFIEASRKITAGKYYESIDFDKMKEDGYVIMPEVESRTFSIIADQNDFGNQQRIACVLNLSEFAELLLGPVNKRRIILDTSEVLYEVYMMVTETIIKNSKW